MVRPRGGDPRLTTSARSAAPASGSLRLHGVVHGGARVEDLVDRFVAGDTLADIADDFGVPEEEVEDVIRVAARAAA